MFERILVPLDESKNAESALAVATQLPSKTLDLLIVKPDCTETDEVCRSQKEGSSYLDQIAERLRGQGRKVQTHVAFGDPGRQIVAFSGPADLVVMGSEGRGATGKLLMGSVADWVARHASVPTMIVRGGDWPAADSPMSRIVVALDGSPLAESALPAAETLATELGLPIHLVRVLDFDPVRAAVQAGMASARAWATSQEDAIRLAEEYVATQAKALRDKGFAASSELRKGVPSSELMNAVHDGDVLLLTTRDRGDVARWFLGSVADELIRHAPCPVLLARATAGTPTDPSGSSARAHSQQRQD